MEDDSLLSPTHKVKFLCSHGGKILPRLPDGQLKYVGGETRVVSVPRCITFSELKKKLTEMCNAEMILKYQVIPEDFDILVSVTCDEDLHHMFNEYDRYDIKSADNCGAPRLRAFLFPSSFTENQTIDAYDIEHRYIDAINGIPNNIRRTASNMNRSIFSVSSNSSSPRSHAPSDHGYTYDQDVFFNSSGFSKGGLHRVSSSPTLYNLANQCQYPYLPSQVQPATFYQASKVPQGFYKGGGERLMTAFSVGPGELGKCQLSHSSPLQYYPRSRSQRVYKGGNVEW